MKYKDLCQICYNSRDLLGMHIKYINFRRGYAKDIDTLMRTIIKFGISVFRNNEDFRLKGRKLYIGEDQHYKFYIGFGDLESGCHYQDLTNMRGVVNIIRVRLLMTRRK